LGLAVFTSVFLPVQVRLLLGKFLLPWFGHFAGVDNVSVILSARSSRQPMMFGGNITMVLILKSRIENRRTD
jgi:hypothetical protein